MKKGIILTFDFSVNDLKKYYSASSTQGAYEVIERFLKNSGFEKTKDSDYICANKDRGLALKSIEQFAEKNKWFPICLKKLSITLINKNWNISEDIKFAYTDEQWKKEKDIENQRLAENQLGKPLDLINSNEAEL